MSEPVTLRELIGRVPQEGRLEWIGVRPGRRVPLESCHEVEVLTDRGLAGDRAADKPGRKRQVTLLQAEHLPVVAAITGHRRVDPAWLRRNLVISGVNVLALERLRFRVGEALLEGTGPCEPCSFMEEALGDGGYVAMIGHGGITARVVEGGPIRLGDAVVGLGWPP